MSKAFWITTGTIAGLGGAYGIGLLLRQARLVKETDISISSFRIKKFGLKESRILLNAIIDNKSDLSFMVHKQKYKLFVGEKQVAVITGTGKELIEPNETTQISLDTIFSPERIFNETGVKEAIKKGEAGKVPVRFEGKLTISSGIFFTSISFTDTTNLGELFKEVNLKSIILSLIGR